MGSLRGLFPRFGSLLQSHTSCAALKLTRGIRDFIETIPKVDKEGKLKIPSVGRSWRAPELRLKSFSDLHKLWYVLVKERNMIYSQREIVHRDKDRLLWRHYSSRLHKCKKSMARIKLVLHERANYAELLKYQLELKKEVKRNTSPQKETKKVSTQASSKA